MAWLYTAPEKEKDSKSEEEPKTRLEAMRDRWSPDWIEDVSQETYDSLRDIYVPELPPIDEAPAYLVAYLFEIGPAVSTGMGPVPLDDARIGWWQQNTGIVLRPWEARWLIRLSKDYLAETHKAKKRGCQSPWAIPGEKLEASALQLSLRSAATE